MSTERDEMNTDDLAFMMAFREMKIGELREKYLNPFMRAKYGADEYAEYVKSKTKEAGV